jgi:hypothetical protein
MPDSSMRGMVGVEVGREREDLRRVVASFWKVLLKRFQWGRRVGAQSSHP